MSRERWQGTQDAEARFLHRRLYAELEDRFGSEPLSLAYDGLLWAVQAGVVTNPRNPSLDALPLTLRRSIHIPELFRADVSLPGIHTSYYEYSEQGGFNLERSGTPGSEVYKGQYVSMHDMVTHMDTDPELTAMAAASITLGYCLTHPDDVPPAEAFAQVVLPSDPDFPPQAA